jgi:hypothetical protein
MKKGPISSIVLMLMMVSGCATPLIANVEQDKVLVQGRPDGAAMRQNASVAPAAGPLGEFAALPEPPGPPEIIPPPPW